MSAAGRRQRKPAQTQARHAFDVNIQRVSYFLDIHEQAQKGRGAPPTPNRELPRGAVVFAVGALDAYLSEVSAEVMVRDIESTIASTDAREILKRIHSELPTLALEVSLLSKPDARRQRIRMR